ncbi:O-antigen polymerase [Halomonas sp. NO4]|uniref:O-antigen polymerase n=1 Tax=Halomonas sp. NO4 TaxID=2484813 RepID=UPI001F08B14F|nr:O-antigen polymerase [Halomonas sp. NO4]
MFRRSPDSPFVGMTPAERITAVCVILSIGLIGAPFALSTEDAGRAVLFCAFLAYLGALALPFVWPLFKAGIFHPIVFYVIWVGVRGLLEGQAILAATGLDYHRALGALSSRELNGLVAKAFLLEAVALLALYMGYTLAPRLWTSSMKLPRTGGLFFKTAAWVGVSGVALLVLASVGGGLETVLMQRGIPSDQRIAALIGGHWNYLATIGGVAPLVWLACEVRAIRRPTFWFLLFTALAIKFSVTGSRGGTVIPLVMVGTLWMMHRRQVPYRVIVLGIVVTLVVVGGLGQYRSATQKVNSFGEVNVQGGLSDWVLTTVEELQSGGGENSGKIAVLGRVPTQVPYLWGESYLSIPFIFIPSAMWGEKPDAAGKLNAIRIYERPLTAIPPGPIGEAYWNFSYAGVLMVFLIYGALLKVLSAFYRTNSGHPLVIIIFLYALFYLQPHSPSVYAFFHAVVPAMVILATFIMPLDRRLLKHGARSRNAVTHSI